MHECPDCGQLCTCDTLAAEGWCAHECDDWDLQQEDAYDGDSDDGDNDFPVGPIGL